MRLRAVVITCSAMLLAMLPPVVSAQFDRFGSAGLPDRIEPELAGDDFAIILSVQGTLGGPHTFEIPVDASFADLHVSPGPGSDDLVTELVRPNGARVVDSDSDVKYGVLRPLDRPWLSPRRLQIIARPQPGLWRLQMSPRSDTKPVQYSLVVFGKSPITFAGFAFVKYGGDVVHGGFFPGRGSPIIGEAAVGEAHVSDTLDRPQFWTVDEEGTVLQRLVLSDDDWVRRRFVGGVPLPSVPFAVLMTATDSSGARVQRRSPETFRAQPVEIAFNTDGPSMSSLFPVAAGSSRKINFTVRNTGPAGRFSITAEAAGATVRDLSPQTIALQSGVSATGTFYLDVPSTARTLDLVEVRLVASNEAEASVRNSTWQRLDVTSPDDLDGDTVPNVRDNCPEFPNADQLDVNSNGIGDACEGDRVWPTTTLGPPPLAAYPGPDFVVSASTDSDAVLQFAIVRGPCAYMGGSTFRPTGVGVCVVMAMTDPTEKYQWSFATLSIPLLPRQ